MQRSGTRRRDICRQRRALSEMRRAGIAMTGVEFEPPDMRHLYVEESDVAGGDLARHDSLFGIPG